jgi:hypothetical protein
MKLSYDKEIERHTLVIGQVEHVLSENEVMGLYYESVPLACKIERSRLENELTEEEKNFNAGWPTIEIKVPPNAIPVLDAMRLFAFFSSRELMIETILLNAIKFFEKNGHMSCDMFKSNL